MLHIALFIPSLDVGGVEKYLVAFANDLQQKGYRVDFVICRSGGLLESGLSKDVTKVNLGNIRLRNAFFPLRNYLKRNVPDVFISCADFPNFVSVPAVLSLRKRPKLIISKQAYENLDDGSIGFPVRKKRWLMKVLYPFADKIYAVSGGIYDFLVHELNIPQEKVTILNNPVSLNNLYAAANQPVDIALPDKYIVFIGRFSRVKNIPLLLRAFDRISLPDMELVLVGDGSEFGRIKQLAAACKKAPFIHFTGGLSNPYPILKNAQALVSCSYSEGFPTVVLEALAFGKTVIATPTKGSLEILGTQFGKYVSAGFEDEKAFAQLVEEAVAAPYPAGLLMREAQKHDLAPAISLLENIISEVYRNGK
ncbi:MAG: glycosyltransferase [Dysgonamonadaceae bacterium]|jgi:glycosyltransferase involved in cell wall biosynthesis|nr:glycosyltransferase [Dysgonamonadaceae bacterium]